MFSVLIVDDEPLIRLGFHSKVDWSTMGFKIVGEATNGLDALTQARALKPDVIITDMKMPVMDGIKLLEALKNDGSKVKVIVVSAYSSFNYTQTAIKAGAFDYILKPIDSEELLDVLFRVKASLEANSSQPNIAHKEQLPEIKEKFLNSFISSGIINEINLESQLVDLGMPLDLKKYLCLAVMIPDLSSIVRNTFEDDYSKAFICITRIIQNLSLSKSFSVTTFRNPLYLYNFYIILGFDSEPSSVLDIIDSLKSDIEAFLLSSVIIGVGKACSNFHEISISFTQALDALSYRKVVDESCIIFNEDLNRQNTTQINYSYERENAFLTSIAICNYEEMDYNIQQLFECIRSNKDVSFRQVYKMFSELLFLCDRALRKYDLGLEQIFNQDITSMDYIAGKGSLPHLEQWFSSVIILIMNHIMDKKSSNMSKIVDEIKSYIDLNYFEAISLNGMSQKFFVNKSYLSALFKKRIGENFIDYVTSVRMNKACELLQANKKNKVYEVGQLVGYTDEKYFSKLFKKCKGMSPEEFKKCTK